MVSGIGGTGGVPSTLLSQIQANRQLTAAQRIRDQETEDADRSIRDAQADQANRTDDPRQTTQESETENGGPGQRLFEDARFGRRQNPFLGPDGSFSSGPFGSQNASFDGNFSRTGEQGFAFERGTIRPRPSSTFIAQAIGQEQRPGGEQPTADSVASLYEQTQGAIDEAVLRNSNAEGRGPVGLVPGVTVSPRPVQPT